MSKHAEGPISYILSRGQRVYLQQKKSYIKKKYMLERIQNYSLMSLLPIIILPIQTNLFLTSQHIKNKAAHNV